MDEAHAFRRVDEAFRRGDLEALRGAVDDPRVIPNGPMPRAVGPCLVYAIYHSPVPFIRTLLEIGADPNGPTDDGFPPLIAALSTGSQGAGASSRPDVDDIVQLLLAFGADPNQRGLNDYTALHVAVAGRNHLAAQRLLDAGADPDLRTRIDDLETALDMARTSGEDEIAATLERRGRPLGRRLRSGLTLDVDIQGKGPPVRRQQRYRLRLRYRVGEGEPVVWGAAIDARPTAADVLPQASTTDVTVTRGQLVSGLFYGVEGMRVGGMRRLRMAPRLAYGDRGVLGVIPPGATLLVEVVVLAESAVAEASQAGCGGQEPV